MILKTPIWLVHLAANQSSVMSIPIFSLLVDWLALHLKFGSVYFQQFGGISRPHVDQLQI